MRYAVLVLVLVSAVPAHAGWTLQNVDIWEQPETSPDFYALRGVPMFVAEAELTSLWNGWQINLAATRECAVSDYNGQPWGGSPTTYCRSGGSRVEFDLIVDSPMEVDWSLWSTSNTTLRFQRDGVNVPGAWTAYWFDINERFMLQPGTYHLRATASAVEHYDEVLDLRLTYVVPEPGTWVMALVGIGAWLVRRRAVKRDRFPRTLVQRSTGVAPSRF